MTHIALVGALIPQVIRTLQAGGFKGDPIFNQACGLYHLETRNVKKLKMVMSNGR